LPFKSFCYLFFYSFFTFFLIFIFLALGLIWRIFFWFFFVYLSLTLRLRGASVSEIVFYRARREAFTFFYRAPAIYSLSYSSFLYFNVFFIFIFFSRLKRIYCLILFINFFITFFVCDSRKRSIIFVIYVFRKMFIKIIYILIFKASVAIA
jgi:hypothetical protein